MTGFFLNLEGLTLLYLCMSVGLDMFIFLIIIKGNETLEF